MFLADPNCTTVTVVNSTFTGNSALSGAVGFLRQRNLTTQFVDDCADCVASGNSASGWGESVLSTEVSQADFQLSAQRVVSGGTFNATLRLLDGAPGLKSTLAVTDPLSVREPRQ